MAGIRISGDIELMGWRNTQDAWLATARESHATRYTTQWSRVMEILVTSSMDKVHQFLFRYVFQVTIHSIWRERNGRRHSDPPTPQAGLIQYIDKLVRNRISSAQRCICRKGYTLLMNTWKRYDLVKKSASQYASCSRLNSIHIVWSEPNPPSDSLKEYLQIKGSKEKKSRDGHEVELRFDINKEDSLNNRFKEMKDLKIVAVFSIDDDIIFPCHTVVFAFNVWERVLQRPWSGSCPVFIGQKKQQYQNSKICNSLLSCLPLGLLFH